MTVFPEVKNPTGRITTKPTGPTSQRKLAEMTDAEQKGALFRGVTISELEILFRMDRRTILGRVGDVQPCGKGRMNADIYHVRDVAPYLVKPAGDLAAFAAKARPQDMPPNTLKEYWNGQRSRQIFLENEGQLWRLDKVVETFGRVFKSIRTTLLLIPDELALKTSLNDTQRAEIQQIIDKTLERTREDLIEQFGGDAQPEDAPGSLEPEVGRDDTFDVPEDPDAGVFEADTDTRGQVGDL